MSDTITVVGNIANDPEHKQTTTGIAITTFRVASSQRRYDRATGQWVEAHTNWYSVSTFRGLAQHVFRSLKKGDRVVLTGKLRVRNWENGTARGTAVEIDADAVGHDLLWGTTSFQKAAGSARTQVEETWPPDETATTTWPTAELGTQWPPSGSAKETDAGAESGEAESGEGDRGRADREGADRTLAVAGADAPF